MGTTGTMKKLLLTNQSERDVLSLGERLAGALFRGAFVALYGDLGAGKTTFARAVGKGLGIDGVVSPTFTIVREYPGKLPLAHFDAYRLSSAEELYGIGFADYLAGGYVVLMEWCENVGAALPEDRLEIRIAGSGDMPRAIEIEAAGPRHAALLEALI